MNWQQLKNNITSAVRRFFYGRNGSDHLTVFIVVASLIISLIAQAARLPWLFLFYYAGIFLCFYRVLSRNLARRRAENQAFLQSAGAVTSWFRLKGKIIRERKTHRYLKCPGCRQQLRVPKGNGKICVTCSRCKMEFTRKT